MLNAKEVVQKYWKDMGSNDFSKAAQNLATDFVCKWPQSNELIKGKENFIKINSQYPAEGKWEFNIHTILGENDKVVTDVSVTDGKIKARAITFHRVENGLIQEQIEYWPEEYEAPKWRTMWVENIQD